MSDTTSTSSGGVGIVSLLGLLFVGLKLGGVISWSWWYVTLPFWGPLCLVLGVIVLVFAFILLKIIFISIFKKKK